MKVLGCVVLAALAGCAGEADDDVEADLSAIDAEKEEGRSGLVRLTGAGDIAKCDSDGDERVADLLDGIEGPLFAAGDIAYEDGSPAQFAACFDPTWGRHKERIRPVPGNHEYHTRGAAGYFEYFGAAAGTPGVGYYSYRLGDWLVLALNSEIDVSSDSEQVRWLRQELASNPTKCAIAYLHKPLFSSGPHGNNSEQRPLYRALHEGGVDVVVAGHDHHYERFYKLDADGNRDEERGFRQFIVGTGGSPLYFVWRQHPYSLKWQNHAHGVIRFTLYPDKYYFKFMPVEGAEFVDQGYRSCSW